jgi:hypothetical protein
VKRATLVAAPALLAATLTSCGIAGEAVPECRGGTRLAIVAQSVPSAAYVPCIDELPQGWTAGGFAVTRGGTRFTVRSPSDAARPVRVRLEESCDVSRATPTAPRAEGVRTYRQLRSISPRYAGTLSDVFSGGCVTYDFDFARGPHIALVEEMEQAVGLFSRRELELQLHRRIGVDLGQAPS